MADAFPHIPAQLVDRLDSFKDLEYDWNSYGAGPIPEWSIAVAKKYVEYGMRMGLPAPWVVPGSGGSVGIEWQIGSKLLYVDIEPLRIPDKVTYLMADDDNGMEIEEALNDGNVDDVVRKFIGLLPGDSPTISGH